MLNKYFLLLFLIMIGLLFSGCNSDIQLVDNNSSEYKIVIPTQSTEIEKYGFRGTSEIYFRNF